MNANRPSTEPAPRVVELSVTVAASPARVWSAITDPANGWMGAFRMVSTWEVGSPLAISGVLNGKPYSETGELIAFEPERLLRYDHWSRLWRLPDTPANRAVLSIRLDPEADGTRVSLTHQLPEVEAIEPHSRFFWTVSLELLRSAVLFSPPRSSLR